MRRQTRTTCGYKCGYLYILIINPIDASKINIKVNKVKPSLPSSTLTINLIRARFKMKIGPQTNLARFLMVLKLKKALRMIKATAEYSNQIAKYTKRASALLPNILVPRPTYTYLVGPFLVLLIVANISLL